MNIGIAGPIDVSAFSAVLDGEPHLRQGYSFPLTTDLAFEYRALGHDVTVFAEDPEATVVEWHRGAGWTVVVVPMRSRARDRARDAFRKERRALTEAMRLAEVDVIHAHWTYEFALAAHASGVPYLTTVHDWAPSVLRHHRDVYRAVRLLMQWRVLARAKDLTAPSPSILSKIERLRYARTTLVPNALSADWFTAARSGDSVAGRIGCIAQGFSERKNVKELIRAFAVARADDNRLTLTLVGADFGPGETAAVWAEENNLALGVSFLGQVPPDRIRAFLDSLEVLVVPSLEESFGMVALEACAREVQVIANAKAQGLSFVLGPDGVSTWNDHHELAELITRTVATLRDTSSEAARLARKADACARFSMRQVARDYEELLQQVASTSCG